VAGLVALPLAVLGGWSVHLHRRHNARPIEAKIGSVNAGDARVLWHLQREGLLRDARRGLALSLVGLAVAWAVHLIPWESITGVAVLEGAVLAGGIAAALGGALRSAGAGARRRWLTVGLATGLVVVLWR
jgi:hypothetical protein